MVSLSMQIISTKGIFHRHAVAIVPFILKRKYDIYCDAVIIQLIECNICSPKYCILYRWDKCDPNINCCVENVALDENWKKRNFELINCD